MIWIRPKCGIYPQLLATLTWWSTVKIWAPRASSRGSEADRNHEIFQPPISEQWGLQPINIGGDDDDDGDDNDDNDDNDDGDDEDDDDDDAGLC